MNIHPLTRCAAAVAFVSATAAIAFPATAVAAPEWDIGAYDHCMATVKAMLYEGKISESNASDAFRECCERTGGLWSLNGNLYPQCHAPSNAKPFTVPSETHVLTPVSKYPRIDDAQPLTPVTP
jgi:hypothetical protein